MNNRPVVNAGRALGALSLVAGVVPIVGSAFGWFVWDTDQLEAYAAGVGVTISALALAFGVQVEKQVTPTNNPKDDAGNVLTPGPIGSEEPTI